MIDLSALEAALGVIEEVGKGELTFQIAATTMTLRPLMPAEEVAVEEYAQEAFRDVPADQAPGRPMASEFLDRFKHAVLSYSVVAVGDQEFREATIATGEVNDDGKTVLIEKHVAVRNMVKRWTRPLLLGVFTKYGELMSTLEMKADKEIKWDPADLAAEIDRVEARLEELKAELEHRETVTPKDSVTDRLRSIASASDLRGRTPSSEAPVVGEEEGASAPATPTPATGASIPAQPPLPAQPPAPTQERRSARPTRASPPSRPPPAAPERATLPVEDSFGDDEDALAAEEKRLLAARRKRQVGRPPEVPDDSQPQARKPRRKPPHRAAANTHDAVVEQGGHQVKAARTPSELPSEAAHRADTEMLSDREPASQKSRTEINPSTAGQSKNPRFKG